MRVDKTDKTTNRKPERYFAATIYQTVKGRVKKSSRVPIFHSSAKKRIHRAGTKNKYNKGTSKKRLHICQLAIRNIINSWNYPQE